MMRRAIVCLLLLISFISPAQAGPKKVFGEIARFGLHALAAGSSVESDRQTDLCRMRTDVARCQGGYGEITPRQALDGIITFTAGALSEYGRHHGFREWFLFEVGVTTWNGVIAYQQSQIKGQPTDEKVTRFNRSFAFPRH